MPIENLALIIEHLYPELEAEVDYTIVQTDESIGPVIDKWPNSVPRPTREEVMAKEQEWEVARDQKEVDIALEIIDAGRFLDRNGVTKRGLLALLRQ